MAEILFIIKIVLCTASFILLCVAALKLNLNPADRAKQFLMPAIALIYGILALIFIMICICCWTEELISLKGIFLL